MRNFFPILSLMILIFLLFGSFTEATVNIDNPLIADNFNELIDSLINIIFYVAMLIAPVFLVVAGFYYLTAAANPENVNTAKSIIIWTLVGLVVIIAAKGIIALFQTITKPHP